MLGIEVPILFTFISDIVLQFHSVLSSELDEKGLRHILLCRVILGKMEVIPCGSMQFHPTSSEFDSGVDNLSAPSRYTVWSCYMNSHIFVDYIVSFGVVCFNGKQQYSFHLKLLVLICDVLL